MIAAVSDSAVRSAIESWELLRQSDDFEHVAGKRLFQHMIKEHPEAKGLFNKAFELDKFPDEEHQMERFVFHAANMLINFDMVLSLLGPDTDLLIELVNELGAKHVKFGVTTCMYPVMRTALVETLDDMLNGKFTDEMKESFVEVYDAIANHMVEIFEKGEAS